MSISENFVKRYQIRRVLRVGEETKHGGSESINFTRETL